MKQVHILMRDIAYDGSEIIRVFEDKTKAEALAEEGNLYNSSFPEPPTGEAPDDATKAFYDNRSEEYRLKLQAWIGSHPIEDGYRHEEYRVTTYDIAP